MYPEGGVYADGGVYAEGGVYEEGGDGGGVYAEGGGVYAEGGGVYTGAGVYAGAVERGRVGEDEEVLGATGGV